METRFPATLNSTTVFAGSIRIALHCTRVWGGRFSIASVAAPGGSVSQRVLWCLYAPVRVSDRAAVCDRESRMKVRQLTQVAADCARSGVATTDRVGACEDCLAAVASAVARVFGEILDLRVQCAPKIAAAAASADHAIHSSVNNPPGARVEQQTNA